jgi:hypothetical protein
MLTNRTKGFSTEMKGFQPLRFSLKSAKRFGVCPSAGAFPRLVLLVNRDKAGASSKMAQNRLFYFTDLNRTQKHGELWLVEVVFIKVNGPLDRRWLATVNRPATGHLGRHIQNYTSKKI